MFRICLRPRCDCDEIRKGALGKQEDKAPKFEGVTPPVSIEPNPPQRMRTSQSGINAIKQFEGYRDHAYLDPTGVPTIGYGTTRIDGKPVKLGMTCTREEAEEWLREDIAWAEDAVERSVKVSLNQFQFDALVSFTYNLGPSALARSTLLRKLNKGDYLGAADEILRWTYAGGKVMRGLITRRTVERDMFLTA